MILTFMVLGSGWWADSPGLPLCAPSTPRPGRLPLRLDQRMFWSLLGFLCFLWESRVYCMARAGGRGGGPGSPSLGKDKSVENCEVSGVQEPSISWV